MDHNHLQLKIMVPTRVLLDTPTQRITVGAKGGSRGFLPRHIDFIATLVPGVLTYVDETGQLGFAALDGGVLVKKGNHLLISTPDAVHSRLVHELETFIEEKARQREEIERSNRGTLARLEVALVRRLMELGR